MTTHSSKTRIPAHPETRDDNRDPISGAPGAHPVGTGVGATGGAASGAVVGGAVGGPVGAVVGAAVGGVAGGLAGKGVAEAVNPTAEDAYWREHYTASRAYEPGRPYSDYQGAYRAGYAGYGLYGGGTRPFDEIEPDLRRDYEREVGSSNLGWERARVAAREAWERVRLTARREGAAAEVGAPALGQKPGAYAEPSSGGRAMAMSKESLRQLDSFLRGELSAVGTYEIAIERLKESLHLGALNEALDSHRRRADALRDHIRMGGGTPAENSGMWGAFAKLYEGGMALLGEKSAIAALESGEDHGIDDFRRGLDALDSVCRDFMEREILPEQKRTHRLISDLKHSLR